ELREFLLRFRVGESERKNSANGAPVLSSRCRQPVQIWPGLQAEGGEIEDLVADRRPAARGFPGILSPENPEGKILDRKIACRIVRRLDPAPQLRVVRGVHLNRFLKPSQVFTS